MARDVITCDIQHIFDSSVNLHERIERQGGAAVALSGYADVWQGQLLAEDGAGQAELVALKFLRLIMPPPTEVAERVRGAVVAWLRLHHPNILQFLGVSMRYANQLCLVSRWQPNGHAIAYLKMHYTEDREGHERVVRLIDGITTGLEYLHGCNIVHGDLKGNNILVTSDGSALLADFGLSLLMDDLGTVASEPFRAGPFLLDGSRTHESTTVQA